MEVSAQLHVPAAFLPRKQSPVHIGSLYIMKVGFMGFASNALLQLEYAIRKVQENQVGLK
jgi:hypothetical protein